MTSDVVCIGSVLWDVIGRSGAAMQHGSDLPGRIARQPGGVALNIAMTLLRFGLRPILLSSVGRDPEGEALLQLCQAHGMDTAHVWRPEDLPTDQYMAIEGPNGLIAAIADAHSLERAGGAILTPLLDGRLGSATAPHAGMIALDGNLTPAVLSDIARAPQFAYADLRIAPASPGKAERLLPFVQTGRGALYVNLEEAGLLCATRFGSAPEAAHALLARGAARVLVTDGANPAADGHEGDVLTGTPPAVPVQRVTGAGDTFMAAHIAAERAGYPRHIALARALDAAAVHVSAGSAA